MRTAATGPSNGLGAQHGRHDLDFSLVPLGEQRPQWAIGEAGRKRGCLGRATFTLGESTRNFTSRVHPLFIIHGQWEERHIFLGFALANRSREHHGIAVTHGYCAHGEAREAAGFQRESTTVNLGTHRGDFCLYVFGK